MSLEFRVEWQEAPGVEDVVDAQTWGRLTILLTPLHGEKVALTRGIDRKTSQLRSGVHGSVFPLARWLADNYWNLLWEPPRIPKARSGRTLARMADLLDWTRRHNLLAAREGFALPDVAFSRDGDFIWVWASPDSVEDAGRRGVRFVESGVYRVEAKAFEVGVATFMDAVLERTRDIAHPDVANLREDWNAVIDSSESEPELCKQAAQLGLDPYDADEFGDDLVGLLEKKLGRIPGMLRSDLLEALPGVSLLEPSANWVAQTSKGLHGAPAPSTSIADGPPAFSAAHEIGYWRARKLRRELDLRAKDDDVLLAAGNRFGFDFKSEKRAPGGEPPSFVDALVAANGGGKPTLFGPDYPFEDRSFRWARALYMWCFGALAEAPRLVTRSHNRTQRESRAFAAEFLAPAAAIKSGLSGPVIDEQEVASLAARFRVRPKLVRHQLENHQLAFVE